MITKKWGEISTRFASMLLAMVLVVGILTIPVSAASSARTTRTVYGITYTFYSQLFTQPNDIQFDVVVEVGQPMEEGYIGGKARLYTSDGTLVKATDWRYNSANTAVIYAFSTFYDPEPNKYYYSKGQVQFYNGNGYTTYTCTSTPNVSGWSRSNIEIMRNQKGEIYGSEIFLNQIGVEPDLIRAVGRNGIVGYVKADDLDSIYAMCPDEAVEFSGNVQPQRVILLYAEDGETVLGDYVIDNASFHEVVYE